jgi:predicted transcriptional regulator
MFHKKFTESDALKQLSMRPMTVFELRNVVGCKDRTTQNLVKSLMDKGLIDRRNRSHPNKPIWEYFMVEMSREVEVKKRVSGMKNPTETQKSRRLIEKGRQL